VDRGFARSLHCALKIARTLVAVAAIISFVISRSHEAYLALVAAEAVITLLFLVLYALRLDRRLRCLFWPLADVFNSVVGALFLLIVCLFAVIIRTNTGTLVGGVLGLLLFVLSVLDAVLLFQKISFSSSRERSAAAK
ncbi:CKLF factor, partial [Penelope pileata]|nr:CKLF factor [Penelope pileata]